MGSRPSPLFAAIWMAAGAGDGPAGVLGRCVDFEERVPDGFPPADRTFPRLLQPLTLRKNETAFLTLCRRNAQMPSRRRESPADVLQVFVGLMLRNFNGC